MHDTYDREGIRFRFPDDWGLTEDRIDGELYVTVTGDETSFWSLTVMRDRPEPIDVIEAAVDAFREEYEELDVYHPETGVGEDAEARDVEFVCLELLNSAYLRAFRTPWFTGLVLYQGNDAELEDTREILEGISRSLEWEELPTESA